MRRPSTSYATHTLTVSNGSSTSSLVSATSDSELSSTACRNITASNQPGRRSRPVLVPYSWPRSTSSFPVSSVSSVGNGPDPTRVTYALATPTTRSMWRGPTPAPVQAPPATGFDDVTNGYVPWSRSRNVACAPSSNTWWPRASASCTKRTVSQTYGASCGASSSRYVATIAARSIASWL